LAGDFIPSATENRDNIANVISENNCQPRNFIQKNKFSKNKDKTKTFPSKNSEFIVNSPISGTQAML
jgi:hypothetical protein